MHAYVVTLDLLQERWRYDVFGCGTVSAHAGPGNNCWTASEQVWMKLQKWCVSLVSSSACTFMCTSSYVSMYVYVYMCYGSLPNYR